MVICSECGSWESEQLADVCPECGQTICHRCGRVESTGEEPWELRRVCPTDFQKTKERAPDI